MTKTSVLLASVGAGVGALGGGGALAYHLLKEEKITVKNTLNKKGHTFLDFEEGKDLNDWKIIAKAYSASKKNRLGTLEITIPSTGKQEATNEQAESLKKACQVAIDNKDYTKENVSAAEQWCVKPITIQELIKKHRKVLTLNEDKAEEQGAWDRKVEDYLKPEAQNKLPNTTLLKATAPTNPANKKTDRDKLRGECNSLIEKKTHDVDFHENYASFNEWCTLPRENNIS